jgi:hypothetical protein
VACLLPLVREEAVDGDKQRMEGIGPDQDCREGGLGNLVKNRTPPRNTAARTQPPARASFLTPPPGRVDPLPQVPKLDLGS